MPTHYRGNEREVRALDAYIKLSRATERLGGKLHEQLSAQGLTQGQFAVLEVLLHLGPMCQRDIGRKLLRSDGNTTTVLDNLERNGLIARERSSEDRRMVYISLTQQGRALIERVFPAHAARVSELLGVLEPAEQDELGRLCKKLGLGIEQLTTGSIQV